MIWMDGSWEVNKGSIYPTIPHLFILSPLLFLVELFATKIHSAGDVIADWNYVNKYYILNCLERRGNVNSV